ncbi:ROK family protein [Rhizobium pusense]|uniref:ROK family transcriptional regulator n=1 Tax=Agrobacterium pusense TaxID=648995 RepID=UPI001F30412B|nr:ROK family transcriptional regulator [Agrobacterium pusense]MDH0912552.1 ROK family protein [Agrobacterium pusense]MDH1098601.1 ROK family protein [Agrobacterium pusense]MDH1115240.1 ROK family protein [Agrobacterium pusense]MDH2197051.1 ROK family protein [Agrobacterium pusense]
MPDMRFAPPNPMRIADRATGLNAVSVRSYNERLLLSLLLQNTEITRLEIGEKTGLSAQTISVLVRSLEQEGLVAKGEAQKGRVGPPTVPVALNPEGAFSIGISVGIKRSEVVLIDFAGAVRYQMQLPNPQHDRDSNQTMFIETIRQAVNIVPKNAQKRLAGIGLALPSSASEGREEKAFFDSLQKEVEQLTGYSVFVQNDITAAAGGESMFGVAKPFSDYLYFYIGANLHSRLVLNHQIHHGNSVVSFDVGVASLEEKLKAAGAPTEHLWQPLAPWPQYNDTAGEWEKRLAEKMQEIVSSLTQLLELEAVIVSSFVPNSVSQNICTLLQKSIPEVNVIASNILNSPKAVGAASLPFISRFMVGA